MTIDYVVRRSDPTPRRLLHRSFAEPEPLTKANAASVGRVVRESLELLAESSDNERVRFGMRVNSPDTVANSLDWVGFAESMSRASKYLGFTIKNYAQREVRQKKSLQKAETPFDIALDLERYGTGTLVGAMDVIDPAAIAYAEVRTGEMIREITESTKNSVRALTAKSLTGSLTVDQLGRKLRDYIPLRTEQVAQLEKYQANQFTRLIADGRTIDKASEISNKLTSTLAKRKLKQRTETIARTELVTAANKGRYAGWEAMHSQGAIDDRSVKEWIAGSGACPRCQALDGMLAPWNGAFPNGMDMPPDHPACRCSAVLLPPDDDIIAQMERQFDTQAEAHDFDLAYAAAGDTARSVLARAAAVEPHTTSLLSILADKAKASLAGLDFKLKTQESLQRKLMTDAAEKGITVGQAGAQVSDALRYTMMVDDAAYTATITSTLAQLRAEGFRIRGKNAWADKTNPYQGYNAALVSSSGQPVELQFHTAKSFDVKNGEMHKLYEEFRLTPDPLRREILSEQMKELANTIPVPDGISALPRIQTEGF